MIALQRGASQPGVCAPCPSGRTPREPASKIPTLPRVNVEGGEPDLREPRTQGRGSARPLCPTTPKTGSEKGQPTPAPPSAWSSARGQLCTQPCSALAPSGPWSPGVASPPTSPYLLLRSSQRRGGGEDGLAGSFQKQRQGQVPYDPGKPVPTGAPTCPVEPPCGRQSPPCVQKDPPPSTRALTRPAEPPRAQQSPTCPATPLTRPMEPADHVPVLWRPGHARLQGATVT